MIDGLLAETCHLGTDNVLYSTDDYAVLSYDLVEYGCEGDRRVELLRRPMNASKPGDQVLMGVADVEYIIGRANSSLHRLRPHCTCRPPG
jgi:hypothetical protein